MKQDAHRYDDIINLPHHVSMTHPRMAQQDRAAQFAPFAALTGHGEAIAETARLTDEKLELDEDYRAELDMKLQLLQGRQGTDQRIAVTYSVPDERKTGGSYRQITGTFRKINTDQRQLSMMDGTQIPFDAIMDIDEV